MAVARLCMVKDKKVCTASHKQVDNEKTFSFHFLKTVPCKVQRLTSMLHRHQHNNKRSSPHLLRGCSKWHGTNKTFPSPYVSAGIGEWKEMA